MSTDRLSATVHAEFRRGAQREPQHNARRDSRDGFRARRAAQLGVNLTLLGPAAALGVGLLVTAIAAWH